MILLTNISNHHKIDLTDPFYIINQYHTPEYLCYGDFNPFKWYWESFPVFIFDNRIIVNIKFYSL